ncbi:autotransporter outer membrane beta-barrel domain-containing protein [Pseudomonas sp. PA15(2017)]|uniref:autotransporter domain-containing protein n=1 Tax=Pseudomonas sp. PA15(2017) TaxID=1932111 RepID=UPI00096765A3|nr:autotransporter domain-containing protein [Pseudomonas sp. PA15(2017)]OLU26258.1 autotransporter outer membrane beta-barrel domain-containing protein [Pseudomonas sp. PA15(2017)]
MACQPHDGFFKRYWKRALLPASISLAFAPYSYSDDLERPSGWEHDFIGVPAARALGLTGKGVEVGVIDSVLYPEHPALQGQDVVQLFLPPTEPNATDDDEVTDHGTSVSSIIVGRQLELADGSVYQGGAAPGVRLFQVGLTDGEDDEEEDVSTDMLESGEEIDASIGLLEPESEPDLAEAVKLLRQNAPNARIINNSYNEDPIGDDAASVDAMFASIDPSVPHPYLDALAEGVHEDRLFVFAAGNESRAQPGPLAALPRLMPELESGFLSVVAIGSDYELTEYSNACGVSKYWCLAAPGDMHIAIVQRNEDDSLFYGIRPDSGTSFAAPLVSASVALLAERFPYMSMPQIRMTMLSTATDLGEPGVDEEFGWGLLNLADAVHGPALLFGDQRVVMDAALGGWHASDTWSNDITGGGVLSKAGSGSLQLLGNNRLEAISVEAGELVLNADNQFSATSEVRGGRLSVDGALAGPALNVDQAGELGGSGTITAPTRIDGALAAYEPGGSLTFTQSLALSPSSITRAAPGVASAIRMDGEAAVATLGGQVQLEPHSDLPGVTDQMLLETANGARYEAGFSGLQQPQGLAEQGLRYDLYFRPESILLSAAATALPGQAELRGNAARNARVLNALRDKPIAWKAGPYNDWLQAAQIRGQLDGLEQRVGGQVYADSLSYLSRQPTRLNDLMHQQVSSDSSGQATRVWLHGLHDSQTNSSSSSAARSREHTNGMVLGVTQAFGERTSTGAAIAHSKGRVNSASGKAELDVTQLTFGLVHAFDSLEQGAYVGATLGAGYFDNTTKRRLPGFTTAKGDSDGYIYHAGVKTGYRWQHNEWSIEPSAGVISTTVDAKRTREKNSELALDVNSKRFTDSSAQLQLRVSRALQADQWLLEPQLSLGYSRSLDSNSVTSNASLQDIRLQQVSANQNRNLFSASLGVSARRGPVSVGFDLHGSDGERVSSSGGSLRVGYDF